MDNIIIKAKLKVKDYLINVMRINNTDYISLTDLARYKIRKIQEMLLLNG